MSEEDKRKAPTTCYGAKRVAGMAAFRCFSEREAVNGERLSVNGKRFTDNR
ncbi:MAG: hypothetical protein M5U34_40930 [Chloroflexi bacterium]|nr:hypothetical protein [Chloroflexota bacterium]